MDIGLFLLRVVVGLLFVGHGTQKLFGWFNGHGLQGTTGFLGSLGYRGGAGAAVLVGATEATSGALLAMGLLTPLAAAGIIGVMFNAIVSVHWRNGMWVENGGMEYPIVLATTGAALAFAGAGAYSLDAAIGWRMSGGAWGFLAIAIGVAAGIAVVSTRRVPASAARQETERRAA